MRALSIRVFANRRGPPARGSRHRGAQGPGRLRQGRAPGLPPGAHSPARSCGNLARVAARVVA